MTGTPSEESTSEDERRGAVDEEMARHEHRAWRTTLVRALATAEYALLVLISSVLLVLAGGILVAAVLSVVESPGSWQERFISLIEELLLVLIVLEIYITVMHHLRGGRLRLEPFIIVAVIAVVRHILSIVIRLTFPGAPPVSHDQLLELSFNSGAVAVLVAALALARWSSRRLPDR
jgi:uncharacterized membrane protein (DUF373 family)